MDKKSLSERDICTKFITPALRKAGWDEMTQIREEVSFTKGRITVRGKLASRGKDKRADYVLYYKPNIPIALIEVLCNQLEKNLASDADIRRLLLDAVLLEALALDTEPKATAGRLGYASGAGQRM